MALLCQSCASLATGHVVRHAIEFASCGANICGERLLGGVRADGEDTIHFHESSPMIQALRHTAPALIGDPTPDGTHYAFPREMARLLSLGLVCERVGPEQDDDEARPAPPRPLSSRRQFTVGQRGQRVPANYAATTVTPVGNRKRSASSATLEDSDRTPAQFRYLFDLPLEMWQKVLGYLSPADRNAFAAASQRTHEIASKPQVLGPLMAANIPPTTLMRLYLRLWRESAATPALRAARDNYMEVMRVAMPSVEAHLALRVIMGERTLQRIADTATRDRMFTAFTRYDPSVPFGARDLSWFTAGPLWHNGPMAAAMVYASYRFLDANTTLRAYMPAWLPELVLLLRTLPLETDRSLSFWSAAHLAAVACPASAFLPMETEFDAIDQLRTRGVTFNREGTGSTLLAMTHGRLREAYTMRLIAAAPEMEWLGAQSTNLFSLTQTGSATLENAFGLSTPLFLTVVQSISAVDGRLIAALSASPTGGNSADDTMPGRGGNFYHSVVFPARDDNDEDDAQVSREIANYAMMVEMCPAVALLSARDSAGQTPLMTMCMWGGALSQFASVVNSHRCREFLPLATDPHGHTALDALLTNGFNADKDGARIDLVRQCIMGAGITGEEIDVPHGAPRMLATLSLARVVNAEQTTVLVEIIRRIVGLLPTPARSSDYANLAAIFDFMLNTREYLWLEMVFLRRLGAVMLATTDPKHSFARDVVHTHYRTGTLTSDQLMRQLLLAVVALEGRTGPTRNAGVAVYDRSTPSPLLAEHEWRAAGYKLK